MINEQNDFFKDILQFFKSHWPHFIVAIPAAIGITVVHEFAHCIGVWIQGGEVTNFVWLPSMTEWGHMEYIFVANARYNQTVVSFAPYMFWILLSLFAGVLACKRKPWPFWSASTMFLWLFVAPLADIANAAIPYLLWNSDNDFYHAFGEMRPAFIIVALLFGIASVTYGYLINKRLYRERSIGLPAYCLLATATALAITASHSF